MIKADLYVDGSFSVSDLSVVKGGMIALVDNQCFGQHYVIRNSAFTSMRNVGGELCAAIFGLSTLMKMVPQGVSLEVTIHHDYVGIAAFVTRAWAAKSVGTITYKESMDLLQKQYAHNLKLKFNKVKAHSGNTWNEAVDTIAKGLDLPGITMLDILEY